MSLGSPIAAQDRKESTGKAASAFMDAGEQEDPIPDLDETLKRLERELIVRAMKRTKGNQAKAAKAPGITDRIMGLRVRNYALDPKEFGSNPDHGLQRP